MLSSSSMLVTLSEPMACEIDIPVQAELERGKRLMETFPTTSYGKIRTMNVPLYSGGKYVASCAHVKLRKD